MSSASALSSGQPLPEILTRRLEALDGSALRRALEPARGADFTSNDYLGFSQDELLAARFRQSLAGIPTGTAGSRLLRGNLELLAEAEATLSRFSGSDDALLFPSGYQANLALLSSLLRSGDHVFSDELNHASLIDGMRLGRATRHVYPHLDLANLRARLESVREEPGLRLVVTESLFSMDGTVAPLARLADLCEEFSARLVVDEAHATGLWRSGHVEALGLRGRVLATVHTGGKALGAAGAWVACSGGLREYLLNFARPVLYSTAPLPALALLLACAARRWEEIGEERAGRVLRDSLRFQNTLKAVIPDFAALEPFPGPLVPIRIGGNREALAAATRLRARGLDVRAIRPPTVPEGEARLRIVIGWNTSDEERSALVSALGELDCFRKKEPGK